MGIRAGVRRQTAVYAQQPHTDSIRGEAADISETCRLPCRCGQPGSWVRGSSRGCGQLTATIPDRLGWRAGPRPPYEAPMAELRS